MVYAYCDVLTRAQAWARTAIDRGLIKEAAAAALFADDFRSVEPLFNASVTSRPLIVAFMGGTGVGKSALINRLAGELIARSGIERPTSREVTLYCHRSLPVDTLPADLPLDRIKISQHDNDDLCALVFIDMPDFDSVEHTNKALVLRWLPHIDVLLYVVSPERYRDFKSWQLLLAEGGRHAWMFVMNQWDRALPEQLDDFRQQLHKAGFTDPLVMRTSCTTPDGDDFTNVLTHLDQLADKQTLSELTLRQEQVRLQALSAILKSCRESLAAQDYPSLLAQVATVWPALIRDLQQGLSWAMKLTAQRLASGLGDTQDVKLWDDWAQTRFDDCLEDVYLQADRYAIAANVLKSNFMPIQTGIGQRVIKLAGAAARHGMVKPGNGLQRGVLTLSAILEIALPLCAMAVVGYQVYAGFYRSATTSVAYLGVDFAVHASLLIALSWLVPHFLRKKLTPSVERAAYKGLQNGLEQALAEIRQEVEHQIRHQEALRDYSLADLQWLIHVCETDNGSKLVDGSALARVMPNSVA